MSYTRLRYHIATGTKRRAQVINVEVADVLTRAIRAEAAARGAHVYAIGMAEDHAHLLVSIPPTVAVSAFVGAIKAKSSLALNRARILPHRFEWQRGYAIFTVSPWQLSRAIAYVLNQRRRHQYLRRQKPQPPP